MSLVIVDYGAGNLRSVYNMVRKVQGVVTISSNIEDIRRATQLVLPGVGAFDYGIRQLKKLDLFSLIKERAQAGVPTLGICLGMQLLARRSEEGELDGLGLIDAEFKRFSFDPPALRVPHVGWNQVNVVKDNALLKRELQELRFYFTHSYYARCVHDDDVIATTSYGYPFVSAYRKNHVYGVQFHPEKSHRFGMAVLKNFLSIQNA